MIIIWLMMAIINILLMEYVASIQHNKMFIKQLQNRISDHLCKEKIQLSSLMVKHQVEKHIRCLEISKINNKVELFLVHCIKIN
jgi:hypothetical protein